jgi:predicted deacylase
MMLRISLFLALVPTALLFAACQTVTPPPNSAAVEPTARPSLQRQATITPRPIETATESPTPTFTAQPPSPTIIAPTAIVLDDFSSEPVVIGTSRGGRPLTALRFGAGARMLMLVGGIHGGWEANTVTLMEELIEHFTDTPNDIPSGVSLMIVPVANPDGLALAAADGEREERSRFNGTGVDLNRNWSCEWSNEAFWRDEQVDPGARPFSEPETRALADFIGEVRPAALLFYHSAANGVFAGECNEQEHGSQALAEVLGEAAGYPYDEPFTQYPVTGVASNWADGEGIPAADVELRSSTDSEYDRNLRGVLAVMEWLADS